MKLKQQLQNGKRNHRRQGFSMTEILVSILVVMILATGALGYQYSSARNVVLSEVHASAARLALLFLESWKGQQADLSFDPTDEFSSDLTIQTSAYGPDVPDNSEGDPLTELGTYEVVIDNMYYYVTLSYDEASELVPMVLNTTIAWHGDYTQGELDGTEDTVGYSTFYVSY